MKQDGDDWRRVVPSPLPRRIFELRPIRWLLEKGTIVICTGGGGIPVMYDEQRRLHGVEVVVDKDLASALLARELEADLFIMATDVDAVYENWGEPNQRAIHKATYVELESRSFAAGSMGPKVIAACWFAEVTGKRAAIGSLNDIEDIVMGDAGTQVSPSERQPSRVFQLTTKLPPLKTD
jgi:carbamate kinase